MRVIALDPGVTTGFAIAKRLGDYALRNPDRFTEGTMFPDPTSSHQILIHTWQDELEVDQLYNAIYEYGPMTVVYEKFTSPAASRHRVELFPVQVIGVARLYALQHNIPEYSHTASQAKRFWTDEKIKRLGLWVPSQGHGMDALRHLLYHLAITMKQKEWIERSKG